MAKISIEDLYRGEGGGEKYGAGGIFGAKCLRCRPVCRILEAVLVPPAPKPTHFTTF